MMTKKELECKLIRNHVYTLKVCVIVEGKKIDTHKVRGVIFDCIVDQDEVRPKKGKWKQDKHTYVRYVFRDDKGWEFALPNPQGDTITGMLSHMPIDNILKVWDKGHCRNHVDVETAQEWREKHLFIKTMEVGWLFVGDEDWSTDTSVI